MNRPIIWQPQPKQVQFLRRTEYEALYGGAAGGGKSDALLAEALYQVDIPQYKALILRKTFPQLKELIDRSLQLYKAAFPRARYNATEHTWRFPSGAQIIFGSMQRTEDRIKYQGQRYDFIAFDELTHFTWEEYSYMFSRNRPSRGPSNGRKTHVYMRAATNPGGIGHAWVKARFIDAAPPMTPIVDDVQIEGPDGSLQTVQRSRIFVPATVFDNQILLHDDPNYIGALGMLPEAERQALLYGSWDSFSGQVFREWKNDPEHYKDHLWTHVIDPFPIPKSWKIWRGFDWGYTKPFSVGWYAADPDGKIYRIREYYGCTDQPNTGVQMDAAEIARNIREIETQDPLLKGHDIIGVADPAIFEESRGESIAAIMAKHPHYVIWHPGDHHRLAGKAQYHYRFAFDANGECLFQVFKTCRHFIRTIPALVYDSKHVEDIDTDGEDHCLIGDTEVWTSDGRKRIEDMVGTKGSVYSSDGQLHAYANVRMTQKNAKVFTVTLEDGSTITATANHRFRLKDGTWKKLSELNEGDDLWTLPSK